MPESRNHSSCHDFTCLIWPFVKSFKYLEIISDASHKYRRSMFSSVRDSESPVKNPEHPARTFQHKQTQFPGLMHVELIVLRKRAAWSKWHPELRVRSPTGVCVCVCVCGNRSSSALCFDSDHVSASVPHMAAWYETCSFCRYAAR